VTWWDSQASPEGVFNPPDGLYDVMTRRQAAYIADEIEPYETVPRWDVIDVGCGVGRLVNPIHNLWPWWEIWGVDPSAEMIAEARRRCDTTLAYFLETKYAQDLVPGMDAGYCVLVFQHLNDSKAAELLAWVADLLWPGARFVSQWVVGNPNRSGERSYPRYRDTVDCLLAAAGFETVREVWDRDVTGYTDEWLWVTSTR